MNRERDRRQRRHSNSENNRRRDENSSRDVRESRDQRESRDTRDRERKSKFKSRSSVSYDQIRAEDEAIKSFKSKNQPLCAKCSKPISDLSSAIMERGGTAPIHFECAMDVLFAEEQLGEGDKIAYIGQGRFGVLNYPNIRDVRHFTIKKIIDWENRGSRGDWRDEMAELYSQIK